MKLTTSRIAGLAALLSPAAIAQGVPVPGTTVPMLFFDTARQPLSATVQHADSGGRITYLIECTSTNPSDCTVHDSTISIVPAATYDFSTGVNGGGSMTIHCSFQADGKTPAICTKTVAGGPSGTTVTSHKPKANEWKYLPVHITKNIQVPGGYTGGGATGGSQPGGSTSTKTGSSTGAGGSEDGKTDYPWDNGANALGLTGVRFSVSTVAAASFIVAQIVFLGL